MGDVELVDPPGSLGLVAGGSVGSSFMRFGFFTERQVGIGSAAQGIEPYIRQQGHLWTDVSYLKENGWLERMEFLPNRPRGTLRGYLQVKQGLKQGPFDALFFLTHNPAVFHPQVLARTPTVLWTDVTPLQLDAQAQHYGHSLEKSSRLRTFKHGLVRQTFERAQAVVGWSNWARRSFVEDYGIAEEKTHVVHPGVDLGRFEPAPRGQNGREVRLLFVGGDFERKGGSLLLSVFREHFASRARLDIVTRDPVSECSGVTVHYGLSAGSPALLDLYRQADVFVLPTQGDCFSIASMEAMAMGLPVVVCDVGGIADIVEVGASGFLTPPRDGFALRDALEALVSSPDKCRTFGRRGREIVEQKFDAEKTAAALIRVLENAALATSKK